MSKATLTLAVDDKLKREMNELKGVNWSEETRQFLENRIRRLKLLQKLDEMTKNSDLTEKDIEELGKQIKIGIARKHSIKA